MGKPKKDSSSVFFSGFVVVVCVFGVCVFVVCGCLA